MRLGYTRDDENYRQDAAYALYATGEDRDAGGLRIPTVCGSNREQDWEPRERTCATCPTPSCGWCKVMQEKE